MAKAPSAAWAWLFWLLLACGWVVMLSGVSALQNVSWGPGFLPAAAAAAAPYPELTRARRPRLPACMQSCGSSNVSESTAGFSGYLAPIDCQHFYQAG